MDVSILIPVRNRLDMTRGCFATLWPTLPAGTRCETIVYDDGSTDGTAEFLAARADRVRVLREADRGWFARNMNRAAAAARGRWLCFLNNDVLLEPSWLAALLEVAERQPRAAAIGNLQRFPQTGRINHAGIVFDSRRQPRHLYLGMPADTPGAGKTRLMQAVTAACWLAPAERFRALGGFDEAYRNGCEDLDYCFRARAAGAEIWYCGASRIGHYGQSTPGRLDEEEANHRRFLDRWGAAIEPDDRKFPAEDGHRPVAPSWPARWARGAWRSPLAAPVRRWTLASVAGVRLRQRLLGYFSR